MNSLQKWFPELVLRTLAVLSIGFILLNGWSVYKAYSVVKDTTLVPSPMPLYSAFPHVVFMLFYAVVLALIQKYLTSEKAIKSWFFPISLVFFFEFFKFYIYGLLMWMNPFG